MIEKMQKYDFAIFYREYEDFLNKIRDIGVVHVHQKSDGLKEDERLNNASHLHKEISDAIKTLEVLDTKDVPIRSISSPEEAFNTYLENRKKSESISAEIVDLNKEVKLVEPWGDFSTERINYLKQNNIYLHLFTCPINKYNEDWKNDFELFEVSKTYTQLFFVVVSKDETPPEMEADIVALPSIEISVLNNKLKVLEQVQKEISDTNLDLAKNSIDLLKTYQNEVLETVEFRAVQLSTSSEADEKLMILEGWCPVKRRKELDLFLQNEGIVYLTNTPIKEDNPPVLLKNNRFNSIFEVIGDFYSSAKYNELDLTPYFAPFYWIFFGFCLGDAGYGLIFVLGGLALKIWGKPEMKKMMYLPILLGVSTIIFGLISGNFFGISLYDKGFLFYKDLDSMMASKGKTINDYLFSLSLLLGVIQIMFGMFIKAANESKQFGWKSSLGTIGWILIILGSVSAYGVKTLEINPIASYAAYGAIGIGGVFALLLNNPNRNIFMNFGAGLWDAYNMATGLLGDILSYIRLFALGISSSILGFVFNSLALQMSGDVPVLKYIIMIIILLVGHGMNLFMASLGSFVHPMRLTFVEFYKNAGFTGGGHKYKPFAKH